jgi:hypothetical protein
MTMETTKVLLAKQKSILLTKLASLACSGRSDVEMASYRNEANEIVKEFMLADRALASIAVLKSNEFSNSERPIDAILAYLDEVGSPASEEEIIDGLVSGGFRLGDPKARLIVLKSIGNHLHGTGARNQLIKSINGLIGKWEWEDARYNR